jgi:uncharacterized phiE125 gp8 family phage protein
VTTKRISEPSTEPLTVDEVKTLVHIDGTADDAALAVWLAAARREAEHRCSRTMIETTWQLTLDEFPAGDEPLRLDYGPVTQIVSVEYIDAAGAAQTLAAAYYTLAPSYGADYLAPAYDTLWPDTLATPNAVTVTYVAGHGGVTEAAKRAAVPAPVRSWIALRTKHLRDVSIALNGNVPPWPEFLDGQLDELREARL